MVAAHFKFPSVVYSPDMSPRSCLLVEYLIFSGWFFCVLFVKGVLLTPLLFVSI